MINICLFGAGRMGRDHAANVFASAYAKLYCVVDPHEASAKSFASDYHCKAYFSAEEALADPMVDAVMIISATSTHSDLIIRSARAGKPIFCEKPIDLDRNRMEECINVIEETGVPFLLGFNRRYDPNFQALYKQMQEGMIGKLESVAITSRDFPLPSLDYLRTSGGMFRDMTIHDFDMARWLLSEEPCEVFASGSCLVNPEIAEFGDIDTAMIILKTASGKLCHISNSRRSAYGYDQRIEAFGEKGMIRAENKKPSSLEYSLETGIHTDNPHPSFPQRYKEAYRLELEHFLRDVIQGKMPLTSANDGRQAFLLAEAAQESLEAGLPVRLSNVQRELSLR
jgi:myo-inositol 2-dehydrogenase/D-chiro-inositol 1-dehydrogenase